MAEYDDLLKAATEQAQPQAAGAYDELLKQATGGGQTGGQSQVSTPQVSTNEAGALAIPAEPESPYDKLLKQANEGPSPSKGLVQTFTDSFQRGTESALQSMPLQLKAVYQGLSGDTEGARASMQQASEIDKQIEGRYGESEWSLDKIHDADTFLHWLSEKLGENGPQMVAGAALSGVGGLGMKALAEYMLKQGMISATSASAMNWAGYMVPTYANSAAFETASTMEEHYKHLFDVDEFGNKQPAIHAGTALLAGLTKGVFDTYVPSKLMGAIQKEGFQLGKTTLGGIAKTAAEEGTTEAIQEYIDWAARRYFDPSHTFFDPGAAWYMGPGASRVLEAGITGAAVGAVYGAPFSVIEQRQEAARGQPPGDRTNLGPIVPGVAPGTGGAPPIPGSSFTVPARDSLLGPATSPLTTRGEAAPPEYRTVPFPTAEQPPMPPLPGGISEPDKVGVFSPDPVSITPVFSNPKTETWKVESDFGDAHVRVDKVKGEVHIASIGLNDEQQQGGGHGFALYNAVINKAFQLGYTVRSDDIVSEKAANMYEALKERGYDVVGPRGQFTADKEGGYYTRGFDLSANQDPGVYKVLAPPPNGPPPLPGSQPVGTIALHPGMREKPFQGLEDISKTMSSPIPANRNNIPAPGMEPASGIPAGPHREAFQAREQALIQSQERAYSQSQANLNRGNFEVIPGGRLEKPEPPPLPKVGPVTSLRQTMIPIRPDGPPLRAMPPSLRSDATGVTPHLNILVEPSDVSERWLDTFDGNVSRYVEQLPNGQPGSRIYTDVEIEAELALNRPAYKQPVFREVDQDMLSKAGISALLGDLPPAPSDRIWFLPKPRAPREILLALYQDIQKTKDVAGYTNLLTMGLRVIPSRGFGFYYTGQVKAGPPTTKYSKQVNRTTVMGWLDPVSGQITSFTNLAPQKGAIVAPIARGVPVALDLNKTKEGVDYKVVKVIDQIGQTREEYQLIKPLDPNKVTPGIVPYPGVPISPYSNNYGKMGGGPTLSVTRVTPGPGKAQFELKLLDEVTKSITEAAPKIEALLRSLGMQIMPAIHVHLTSPLDAHHNYIMQTGDIYLAANTFYEKEKLSGKADALAVMLHEVGHWVTLYYFQRLPPAIQASLAYAHQKAQIASTAGDNSKVSFPPGSGDTSHPHYRYYTTLVEWLAEQFRRWSSTNEKAVGYVNSSFEAGAKKLEEYYKAVETQFGLKHTANLSRPDYAFSHAMEYLRNFAAKSYLVQQLVRQQSLFDVNQEVFRSPAAFEVAEKVIAAIKELAPMFPESVRVKLNMTLDPGILGPSGPTLPSSSDAMARYIPAYTSPRLMNGLIELAMASYTNDARYEMANRPAVVLAHELMHAYEFLGLISPEEIAILDRDIAARGFADIQFPPQQQAALRKRVADYGATQGWSPPQIEAKYQEMKGREFRAYYMQEFIKSGGTQAKSLEAKGIFAKIMQVLERIRNKMAGLGYRNKNDIIQAFLSGEIAQREKADAAWQQKMNNHQLLVAHAIDQALVQDLYDKTTETPLGTIKAIYSGREGARPIDQDIVTYHMFEPGGKLVGMIELVNRMPRGFEISHIESDRALIANALDQHAQRDLGIPMKLAGELTEKGFAAASLKMRIKRTPEVMGLYTRVKRDIADFGTRVYYASPFTVRERYQFWQETARAMQRGEDVPFRGSATQAQSWYLYWKRKYDALPKDVWSDPRLDQMFNTTRNVLRDETQMSMIRHGQSVEEGQLLQSLGIQPETPAVDNFQSSFEQKQAVSQAKNSRLTGKPFETSAPDSVLTLEMRNTYEWASNYGSTPAVRAELVNQAHEADRIGWFTKWFWNLKQLAFRNQHIRWLLEYVNNADLMRIMAEQWLQRANERARQWEQVPEGPRREGVADAVFALTEMEYLSGAERLAGTVRLPTGWVDFMAGNPPTGETLNLFTNHRVDPQDYGLIRAVQKDFMDFLQATQDTMEKNLGRTFAGNPTALAQALTKLRAEFDEMRKKPYFPMVRFGEFTIAVRDESSKKVIWSSAYGTQAERDAAVAHVRAQHPLDDITISRVDPRFHEFMGLPGPLLRALKSELPVALGLSTTDTTKLYTWIEEFEMMNSPDRSFRKRWLVRKGLPGYNLDAFRVYAHYFTYGSRYLARLTYMNQMQAAIHAVATSATNGTIGNSAKRSAIARYMDNHFKYVMEGGDDAGKMRSFAAFWFLGLSPAAAFTNLTQTWITTIPALGAHFGVAAAYSTIPATGKALKSMGGHAVGSPAFMRAKMEGIRQGIIDIGQAATLAGFADGLNLVPLLSGTRQQIIWRNLQDYAMKMFSVTEQFNRQFTFKASWDLAMKYPNVKRLRELDSLYDLELIQIQKDAGLSRQEAVAFLFAKEMIERTQFDYGKDADAPFMRNPKAKDLLIFFKYTQNMLYALRFNGAMTHMFLVMAFLFGVGGLPFADEFSEGAQLILKFANWLFGTNFDLNGAARKFVRELTRGTIFDEVGPDLFLHGVSRYGFGLGLLPHSWGMPAFDASANGSMGKIIPGLAEFMHGINTDSKMKDVFADAAQKAGGAGYGLIMQAMNVMMDPFSVDGHKAEQLLPRFLRGMAKAYRYLPEDSGLPSLPVVGAPRGGETTRAGARIAKFDITDPGDLTTVLAQAFGYTSTKVAMTWDVIREAKEAIQVYNARRSAIYAQFDRALLTRDPQAIASVQKAVADYNQRVSEIDPGMVIKPNQLQASIRQRMQARGMMEQTLAGNKKEYLVTRRVLDQYPGVRIEQVK